MTEAPLPVEAAPHRRPRLGYGMAAAAAVLWGVNGTVSKVILTSGFSSLRLAQIRSLGAAVGLLLVVAAVAPRRLRLERRELAYLAVFGIAGLALVQWFYFLALHRLAVGIALLIEYLAPLLVALWARFGYHEHVRQRVWAALALALAGLALIVNVMGGSSVSPTGVVFALCAAFAYMLYLLLAERALGGRDAVSLLGFGFLFASLFWAFVTPWWSFPAGRLTARTSLFGHLAGTHVPVWLLVTWMIVLGTIAPFFLLVDALRHLPATRVAIVAMLEPVTAAVVAWVWLGESLNATQLVGAGIVLAAIVLAQTAR